MIERIISGGQTGADQAALDAALAWRIPHGGWVPKGRKTEAGKLPHKYHLQETSTVEYAERTEKNVLDSDGTVIFSHGKLKGGSNYTREVAESHQRPCLHLDLDLVNGVEAAKKLNSWIERNRIKTLNVAGTRASEDRAIYQAVMKIMITLFHLDLIKSTLPDPAKAAPFFPENVEQAVHKIEELLPLRERSYLANLKKHELVKLLPTLGEYIRKKFGLWTGNKALLESCRLRTGEEEIDETRALVIIMESLWYHLQETHRLRVV